MLAHLAVVLGPCRVYTGMPHEPSETGISIIPGPAYDKRSKFRRASSWLRFLIGATRVGVRAPHGTFVFAATNPPFLLHLAWFLRLLRGHRYALLIWDLYPDHVVKIGWLGDRNPIIRAWRALNRSAFRDAEVVITLSDGMAQEIRRQLRPSDQCRIEVIPNWADVDVIRPISKDANPFAQAHGQIDKLTVMYSGNLGATHGTGVIAEVADACRDDHRIAFLVVGEGLGRRTLGEEVRRRGLSNVTFADYQPWGTLPLSLATGDIALVLQAPGTEHLSVPSKTYSCLAAGSAILALTSAESGLGHLVREHNVGIVHPMGDPEGIARAIRELADDQERLAAMRARARRTAEDHFSLEAVCCRFEEALAPCFTRAGKKMPP